MVTGEMTPNAVAIGGSSGEDGGAGRGANAVGGVTLGEFHTLCSELVEVGGGDDLGAVGAEVAVADIVAVDDDDVGFFGGEAEGGREGEGREEEGGEFVVHGFEIVWWEDREKIFGYEEDFYVG